MSKRLTFIYTDGTVAIWKVDSASWGDASRNVVLRRAKLMTMGEVQQTNPREVALSLIPLAEVKSMFEEDWYA